MIKINEKSKKILSCIFFVGIVSLSYTTNAMNIVVKAILQKAFSRALPIIVSRVFKEEKKIIQKMLMFGKTVKATSIRQEPTYRMSIKDIRQMLDGPFWKDIDKRLEQAFNKFLEEKNAVNQNIEESLIEDYTSGIQLVEELISDSVKGLTDQNEILMESSLIDLSKEEYKENKILLQNIMTAIQEGYKSTSQEISPTDIETYKRLLNEKFEGEKKIKDLFGQCFMIGMAIGSWCKQIYKEIRQEDLEFEMFEEELKHSEVLKEIYQKSIKEITDILYDLANASQVEEKIASLITLNQIKIPGRFGFELNTLIQKVNGYLVDSNGEIHINRKFDHIIKNMIHNFNSQTPETGFCNRFLSKVEFVKCFKSKVYTKVEQSIVNENKFNKFFFQIIELMSFDNNRAIESSKKAYQLVLSYIQDNPKYASVLYKYVMSDERAIPLNFYGIPKVFENDPEYVIAIEQYKKEIISYDNAWNFLFKRYQKKQAICDALNVQNLSKEADRFIYKLIEKELDYSNLLSLLKKMLNKKPYLKKAVYQAFFTKQGILKALVKRSTLYPQLRKMPSCLQSPEIVDILNRFLLLEQNKTTLPFIKKGLNYLICAAITKNSNYINLARIYLQSISNKNFKKLTNLPNFKRYYTNKEQNLLHNKLLSNVVDAIQKIQTTDKYTKVLGKFNIQALYYAQSLLDINDLTNAPKVINNLNMLILNESNILTYKSITKTLKQYADLPAVYEQNTLLKSFLVHGLEQFKYDNLVKAVLEAYAKQELLLADLSLLSDEARANYKYFIEANEQACKVLENIVKQDVIVEIEAFKADLLSRISFDLAKEQHRKSPITVEKLTTLFNDCADYNENIMKCVSQIEGEKVELCDQDLAAKTNNIGTCGTGQLPAQEIEIPSCLQQEQSEVKICNTSKISKTEFETWVCNFSKQRQKEKSIEALDSQLSANIFGKYGKEADSKPKEKTKCPGKNCGDIHEVHPHGIYEPADYHPELEKVKNLGKVNQSAAEHRSKSVAPIDGQHALDHSVPVKETSNQRIALSRGQIVILDQTKKGYFHGHIREWRKLNDNQKRTLFKSGWVKNIQKGYINFPEWATLRE